VSFHLFLDGPVMELFVDDRLALAANLYEHQAGGLALMARDGEVSFRDLSVRTLPS